MNTDSAMSANGFAMITEAVGKNGIPTVCQVRTQIKGHLTTKDRIPVKVISAILINPAVPGITCAILTVITVGLIDSFHNRILVFSL
jgi:hypothetical protein